MGSPWIFPSIWNFRWHNRWNGRGYDPGIFMEDTKKSQLFLVHYPDYQLSYSINLGLFALVDIRSNSGYGLFSNRFCGNNSNLCTIEEIACELVVILFDTGHRCNHLYCEHGLFYNFFRRVLIAIEQQYKIKGVRLGFATLPGFQPRLQGRLFRFFSPNPVLVADATRWATGNL